ncbi:hypothetical protein, partial [Flavobacterium sp.]|uniref:hypothetical protein n=1 Tax=Flavobacterium sp. TaxID=239 RepID=UPI0037BE7549
MKRFFLFFIFSLFLACDKYSSNDGKNKQSLDSISMYLDKTNNYELPEATALEYLAKTESLVNALPKDTLYFRNKVYVAFMYYNWGKNDKFKAMSYELIDETKKAKDSLYLARAYSYVGDYYADEILMDSAVINYKNAEKVYFGIKDNVGIGKMNVKMASAKFRVRDYLGSEKSAVLALTYIRLANNKLLEYEANNILGLTCIETKNYEKAKDYIQKSYELAKDEKLENLGMFQSKAVSLNNLGLLNSKIGNNKEALKYFNQAIQEPNLEQEYPGLYATVLNNRAKAKLKLDDFYNLPYEFFTALEIRKEYELTPEIVISKINISEYYQKKGIVDSAQHFARDAYKMAKQTNILNLQLEAIDQLSKVEPENQSAFSKEYVKLTDSLLQAERNVSEKFARIEYETDEFKRQKEQLASQNRSIIIFAFFAIFIIILLYVIRDQRSRNKYFRLREEQQKANEEIYSLMLSQQRKLDEVVLKEKQRIGQELHDGVLGRLFGARLNLDSLNRKDDELAIAGRDHYIAELKFIEQDIREIS